MIKKIYLRRFKKFSEQTIELILTGLTVLAGGNNSGKSTLLHALAVWEFCKMYLENEKGKESLIDTANKEGVGINIDDFSPINIPNLSYLWTNLNSGVDKSRGDTDGYTLKIGCYWDLPHKSECYLEIGLALANDRMFIKKTASNITLTDKIPTIAYLPPFAGITDKEGWFSRADRRRLIGRGLAGAVLRNTLIELFNEYIRLYNEKRQQLQGDFKRLPKNKKSELENLSSWNTLNNVLGEIFQHHLIAERFDPIFHNYIRINTYKIDENGKKLPNYNERDIMVEGSGFLQWLSVYTFALDPEIDILLLDEPDAHLHCSLQIHLIDKLEEIVKSKNKQSLLASHSTEIIKNFDSQKIMKIENGSGRYLNEDSQKIGLLAGLGTEYNPLIFKLQRTRKLLLVENKSDADLLKILSQKLGISWNDNLVVWQTATGHSERKQLVLQIKDKIPNLTALSLVDRDNDEISTTLSSLKDKDFPNDLSEHGNIILRYRKWRRRDIESYLINPISIARAANISVDLVNSFLSTNFSIVVPSNYTQSNPDDRLSSLFYLDCKPITKKLEKEENFKITKYDIANNMLEAEICDDVKTIIQELSQI